MEIASFCVVWKIYHIYITFDLYFKTANTYFTTWSPYSISVDNIQIQFNYLSGSIFSIYTTEATFNSRRKINYYINTRSELLNKIHRIYIYNKLSFIYQYHYFSSLISWVCIYVKENVLQKVSIQSIKVYPCWLEFQFMYIN